jgi:hypothetical protein
MYVRRLAQLFVLSGALATCMVTATPASAHWVSTSHAGTSGAFATATTSKTKPLSHAGVVLDSLHSCSPGSVVTYAVRGSGEQDGPGKPNDALISLLQRSHVFAHDTIFASGYQASGALIWLSIIGGGYFDSVSKGSILGYADVDEFMSRCPQSVFVLLGYSQGADVVRNIVCKLSAAERARIAQVVLFGDPHFSPVEPGIELAGTHQDHGYLGPFGSLLPSSNLIGTMTPHVLSFCDFGDPVCQTHGGIINLNFLDSTNPHYLYASHALDAARITARNVLAAGATPGTASTGGKTAPPAGTPVTTAPTAPTPHCAGYCVHGTAGALTAHVAPDAGSALAGSHAEGSLLSITCQAKGSAVGGSVIWDQLADGSWVADYYTTTPNYNAFSPPLPQCGGVVAPPVLTSLPVPAGSYRYVVKGTGGIGLHARNAPSTSGTLVTTYAEGGAIDITCQVRSDSDVQGSTIWDQLVDSSWVSDFYTSTPVFNGFSAPIPQCATPPPVTLTPPPPTTVSGGQTTYRYNVTGTGGIGLNERQGPSAAGAVLANDPDGAALDIVCQDHGDVIHGSAIWDKLADGNWVTDYYTTTPNFNAFSPPIPQCAAAAPPTTTPPTDNPPVTTPPAPPPTYRYAVVGTGGIGLNERQGPSASGPVLASDAEGAPLDIVCQSTGDTVHGSTIWDKLADGNWVTDYYTTTPNYAAFSPPIPHC